MSIQESPTSIRYEGMPVTDLDSSKDPTSSLAKSSSEIPHLDSLPLPIREAVERINRPMAGFDDLRHSDGRPLSPAEQLRETKVQFANTAHYCLAEWKSPLHPDPVEDVVNFIREVVKESEDPTDE